MNRSWLLCFPAIAVAFALSPACTDEGEDDVGTGGASTTSTTSSSPSGTTTSSTGTAGGGGGEGGGGGGPSSGCLPASATAAYFTINESTLCAVATYTAAGLALDGYTGTATWGSHGGPLTGLGSDTTLTVSRWSVPSDGAELTASDTSIPVTVQAGAFWSGQVLDVSPTVAVAAWTGTPFTAFGGLVAVSGGAATQEDALGVYALGVTQGRLLYTGASAPGINTLGTNSLYGATVTASAITADGVVDTWGSASGPIAVDTLGNAFAVMTDFNVGEQEVRGFRADLVGPGGSETNGVAMATLDGFGNNLAAIVPDGANPGLVLFQPIDGTTFTNLDVVAIPYTIDQGAIVGGGAPSPALTLTEAGANLTLMTDDAGRLWVGALQTSSTTDSVFFVLDRAPR